MRMLSFAKRCSKEILRDPINIAFGLGFPVALLFLLTAIQSSVPVDLFTIERLCPGISVFGLSFMTLFSATLVSRDRESLFLLRLYTTPMRSFDFILGYTLPLLPMAIAEGAICYAVGILLGLSPSVNIICALLLRIPVSLFYIALGLLFGSILNVKQVGGICGALLTNLSAWLSGVWFDLSLVGGVFERIAKILPFLHATEAERSIISGAFAYALPHLLICSIYAVLTTVLAILLFLRQMKKG